ncbi:MAG: hypothetical protein KAV00_03605 [Phycisphaerae bacterium]|nr:hypothetical protein [Phycisphaerae bacterium]
MTDNDNSQKRESDSSKTGEHLPVLSNKQFIQLGSNIAHVDLTGLTEQQIQELKAKHANTMIETNKRAAELVTDVKILRESLSTMAGAANEVASQEGQSITITQRQKNALGNTEIIIGNTDAAQRGKLGRDTTMIWFGLAIVIIIAIVIIAVTRG